MHLEDSSPWANPAKKKLYVYTIHYVLDKARKRKITEKGFYEPVRIKKEDALDRPVYFYCKLNNAQ